MSGPPATDPLAADARPPTPAWVVAMGLIGLVGLLAIIVLLLVGGDHGPGQHLP